MSREIVVAAAQLGPIARAESRASVVNRMVALMREAHGRGARLVVFPELALTTFFPRWWIDDSDELDGFYEREMPSAETQPLFETARDLGVGFYLGYAEMTPDRRRFNTAILVDQAGAIVGKYRKVHLPGHAEYDPARPWQHLEKGYFEPGDLGFPVWRSMGGVMGMCICNDRRWPETYRVMGLQGVEMVLCGYNTSIGLGEPAADVGGQALGVVELGEVRVGRAGGEGDGGGDDRTREGAAAGFVDADEVGAAGFDGPALDRADDRVARGSREEIGLARRHQASMTIGIGRALGATWPATKTSIGCWSPRSARPPTAASTAEPTAAAATVRKPRRVRAGAAPEPVAGVGAGLAVAVVPAGARRRSTSSVAAPAAPPLKAATADQPSDASSTRPPAMAPNAAKAANAATPTHSRRRAARPTTTPTSSATTTIPPSSAVLLAWPSAAIDERMTVVGAWSMTQSPTAATSDGAAPERPATSSVTPSATPAATAPASPAQAGSARSSRPACSAAERAAPLATRPPSPLPPAGPRREADYEPAAGGCRRPVADAVHQEP